MLKTGNPTAIREIEPPTCEEEVSSDSWHWYPCGRKAKYAVCYTDRDGTPRKHYVCGTHVKPYAMKLDKGTT